METLLGPIVRNETNVRFTEDSFCAQQWVLPLTVEKKGQKSHNSPFPSFSSFSSFSFPFALQAGLFR